MSIPGCLVIGVTGHRKLADEARLAAKIDAVLDEITAQPPGERASQEAAGSRPRSHGTGLPMAIGRGEGRNETPVRLVALSPLAEGADRLVAERVLAREGSELEVVLPLDEVDYEADFKTDASRAEFRALLARARTVHWMSRAPSRNEAYAAAGRYVVDHCDVMIAVWDGRAANGPGGTADIVAYARERGTRLVMIQP
jgi:hypothetical protein